MSGGVIGLLTDFGTKDYYVSAMKAVILRIAPDVRIIDISHDVEKWNIVQGAFILWQTVPFFPDSAVIVGVVDPGVGGRRKPIIIKGRKHYFVGPDNGLLSLAAEKEGIEKVFEIKNERYMLKRSGTFDGRDVFSPIAAYIAKGVSPEEIGPEIKEYSKISLPKPRYVGNKLELEVIHVDHFGNIITNVPVDSFMRWRGNSNFFELEIGLRKFKLSLARSYESAITKIFLIPGSSGLIEISMNRASASRALSIRPGFRLFLRKLP